MRIVSTTQRRLEIEHKSFIGSALCLLVFGLLGWVTVTETVGRSLEEILIGYTFVLLPVGYLFLVTQTSRVALDRDLATVRFFRKTLLNERTLEMPLENFFGARVEINEGRSTSYRLYLIFESDAETWQIPVSGFQSAVSRGGIKDAINDWWGVSAEKVEFRYPARPAFRWF